MTEKRATTRRKLPRAQAGARRSQGVFELLNDQLVRELPVLLEQRVPYFDPSFEAMIRMQCKVRRGGYEKLSGVRGASPAPSAPPFISPAASLPFAWRLAIISGYADPAAHQILQRQHTRRLRRRTARRTGWGVLQKCANSPSAARPRLSVRP